MNKRKLESNRPQILITNDDGIYAPGIYFLWKALKDHADITVVAPAGEQSAKALSITLSQPLHIRKVSWEGNTENLWSVTGTPADCVKLALREILNKTPDLIVSGINRGSNLGRNVLYSGTVGAAIEGSFQDIPSIAFSCQDFFEPDYETASRYIPHIIEYILNHPLPEGTLLNVNFPEKKLGKFKGFKMTSQGNNQWIENPDKRTHPAEGHHYYWLGCQLKRKASNDVWIEQGYITAVPVHIGDLTDWSHLKDKKEHFEKFFPEE